MSEAQVNRHAVRWTEPSRSPADSLPAGNGEIGINVWTEANGDVCMYLARTDAFSQDCRLLKLGRVRLTVTPSPFTDTPAVVQFLNLARGRVEITLGEGDLQVSLWVWVDAEHPIVHVEAQGTAPFELTAKLEVWRTEPREIDKGREMHSAYGLGGRGTPVIEQPDTIVTTSHQRVMWYHRNESSVFPANMKLQGLDAFAESMPDPLLHRTFGGMMGGPKMKKLDDTTLRSKAAEKRQEVDIVLHTQIADTPEQWIAGINDAVTDALTMDFKQLRAAHERFWRNFWQRSWISVSGTPDADRVSQAYALQRYLFACAGRGNYPVKFNGSLFTVDWGAKDEAFDPDYRRWGAHYWFQNTRLVYWPMLMAGDFDLMHTWWQFMHDLLPIARERTRVYFNHGGACFPETITFWGTYCDENFGFDREGRSVGECTNTYIRWYWSGALELIAIMLDYAAFTGDATFVQDRLLPMVRETLQFYDEHYPRDAAGKLRLEPAQALETWHEAINPTPDIAGLAHVLDHLQSQITYAATTADAALWAKLRSELPEIPMTTTDAGEPIIAQAEQLISAIANSENPNLYAVFPYRCFGLDRPDLDVAQRTYEHRVNKHLGGWYQDPIHAAMLGLTDEARDTLVKDCWSTFEKSWFPAFWGPHNDWIPDQDNGGVIMIALQRMLLQYEGDALHLMPAWPKEWDVSFKLHAPKGTTVEGRISKGKVVQLKTTPKKREKAIRVEANSH
jgi:hypothetical protein